MTLLDRIKKILKMCGHAFTITVHDRLETMEQRQAETDNVMLRASIRLAEQIRRGGRYEVVPSDDPRNFHPALVLARHLYSMFPTHGARVIGCDPEDSQWPSELARMGYTFDPADPDESLAIVRIFGRAVGDAFSNVELGSARPSVVIADLEAGPEDRVQGMKSLDYRWYLVVENPKPGEAGRFYANDPIILPEWRGETVFFRDYATFSYALRWCEAVLRQVYFGPPENSD